VEQSRQTAQALGRSTFRVVVAVGGAAIAAATAAGVVLAAHLVTVSHVHPAAAPSARQPIVRTVKGSPPGARKVEDEFVGVINAHSRRDRKPSEDQPGLLRAGRPRVVSVLVRPGRPAESGCVHRRDAEVGA
jgi:hypothetical protein